MKPKTTLVHYLLKGHTDRKSRILSYISKYKVAEDIFSQIDSSAISTTDDQSIPLSTYRIPPAEKGRPDSHPVFRLLEANPHPAILSACLFGSLADGTACNYSDFDGLLVIDCSRIESAVSLLRLRKIIERSEELMLETDPLQHHGWHIVLTDPARTIISIDLPTGILAETKAVVPARPLELQCSISKPLHHAYESYQRTTRSIRRKLEDKRSGYCLYTFKSLCSELMLIPALFLQAKGHPVSKKESFKSIEKFISQDKLSALRTVSDWRRTWTKTPLDSKVLLFHKLKKNGLHLSFLLPPVPESIKQSLPEWKSRTESFLGACDNALEENRSQR